jgi:HTH-type transcriptional regulator / antitoxin HigA
MDIKVLRSEQDHQRALQAAGALVSRDPVPGSADAERLDLLSLLIEDYEKRTFVFETLDPVDVIEFRMTEQGLRQKDLVSMLGSRSRVSEVLSRKRPLTIQMIRALSVGLDIPVDALIGAEPTQKSMPHRDTKDAEIEWKQFPYGEMERRGWFKGVRVSGTTTEERVQSFLRQVVPKSSVEALFRRGIQGAEVTKKSYYSTLAWSARVLMRAQQSSTHLARFNPAKISTETLRDLARLSWLANGPSLAIEFLAKLGIAVVIEKRLRNAVFDGAALLAGNGQPVVGLTLRIDRVDYFWFTLMHEVVHVWRHLGSSGDAFIDRVERIVTADRAQEAKEDEANRIARDALIKRSVWERSAAHLAPSREAIQELADKLHIHPSIVAGRVQFETGQYNQFREFLGQGEIGKQLDIAPTKENGKP